MLKFNIDLEKEELYKKFEQLKNKQKIEKSVLRKGLQIAAREAKKDARKRVLKKNTGELAKSIKYKTFRQGSAGQLFSSLYYAKFQEKGTKTRYAKSKKGMVFKINEQWVRKKILPAIKGKFFMKKRFEEVFIENKYKKDLDKILQKTFDRIMK